MAAPSQHPEMMTAGTEILVHPCGSNCRWRNKPTDITCKGRGRPSPRAMAVLPMGPRPGNCDANVPSKAPYMTLASNKTPTIIAAFANNLNMVLNMLSLFRLFSVLNQPLVSAKTAEGSKTLLDICSLYTVYKNLLNSHLLSPAVPKQSATQILIPT